MKIFRYIIISLLISCSICGIGMCLSEYIKISGYTQNEYSYNINDSIKFINDSIKFINNNDFNESNITNSSYSKVKRTYNLNALHNESNITDYNSAYSRARRTYNLNTLRNTGTYGGYGYKYGHGY